MVARGGGDGTAIGSEHRPVRDRKAQRIADRNGAMKRRTSEDKNTSTSVTGGESTPHNLFALLFF
jgi:hypothetical protein